MTDLLNALDSRAFHELCMDYRAADPQAVGDAFARIRAFISDAAPNYHDAPPGSAGFEGWFARNYNGEVVFHDPAWHARRIYPVAVWHARQSLQRPTDREQALQARIDELMLEHCPDEMTQAQRDEWARHQQPVSADMQAELDAAMPRAPHCDRPPAGWRCTRQKGHSGPCAVHCDSSAPAGAAPAVAPHHGPGHGIGWGGTGVPTGGGYGPAI